MNGTHFNISENLNKALEAAKSAAAGNNSSEIGTEHILYGLASVKNSAAGKLLAEYKVDPELLDEIFEQAPSFVGFSGQADYSSNVKFIIKRARDIAVEQGLSYITTEHMLLSLCLVEQCVAVQFMTKALRVNLREFVAKLQSRMGAESGGGTAAQSPNYQSKLPDKLKDVGIDLTQKARNHKIDPIIGRQSEIERIVQILCRKTKNNPVLIGEPGVGKSAVVEGLAQAIVDKNVPELLKDKIIFTLDVGSLMAGTKYRGSLEEKLKDIIDTIVDAKNIIVFIDELHTLATAGHDKGEVSPSDMFKPYLARGELQTIGATTTDEYRKFIEKDKALERRFQPIMVNPPTIEETVAILRGLRDNYEAFHKVKITDEAIDAAVKLSDRYIMDRFLPDKAIDLIDEASSKAKVSGNTAPAGLKEIEERLKILNDEKKEAARQEDYAKAELKRKEYDAAAAEIEKLKADWEEQRVKAKMSIDADDIANIVSAWTKIPVTKINETEKERLLKLEEILHKRVIGQEEAVNAVSKAIRRARAGLKDPKRPVGSFIFLGPTGVGKTELCKALAEAMFDDENLIIRLDMSEYMESHSVSKLIGSPPGYVGYDEGGQLTEQVRRKPYSVILFDEIEKAHPDLFNALLQIMDEGRLTDSQGRAVNFKNTIVIMTSNVGVGDLKTSNALGFAEDAGRRQDEKNRDILMSALKRKFKPEFLNRVDVITVFNPLSETDIQKITAIMLANVNKKLKEKDITLTCGADVIAKLTKDGFDPEYGARPLRRTIEQTIEDALAEKILQGDFTDGDSIAAAVDADGKIVFKKYN